MRKKVVLFCKSKASSIFAYAFSSSGVLIKRCSDKYAAFLSEYQH